MISKSTTFYYLIQKSSLTSTSMSCHNALLQNYNNEISENLFVVPRYIFCENWFKWFYVASHNQLYRRPLPKIFIEISSKRIKVGVAFIFRHLVDIMALWYKSNVFESSLNNLRLFFSMHSNSNRIIQSFILKEKQVLMQAYSFLAGAGQLKTFFKLL